MSFRVRVEFKVILNMNGIPYTESTKMNNMWACTKQGTRLESEKIQKSPCHFDQLPESVGKLCRSFSHGSVWKRSPKGHWLSISDEQGLRRWRWPKAKARGCCPVVEVERSSSCLRECILKGKKKSLKDF